MAKYIAVIDDDDLENFELDAPDAESAHRKATWAIPIDQRDQIKIEVKKVVTK